MAAYVPGQEPVIAAADIPDAPENGFAKHFPGKCEWVERVRIVDGDTIEKPDGTFVRFIGVDTPELKHPTKPVEPGAIEASARTKELIGNGKVCLLTDKKSDSIDQYGRDLRYVITADGQDVQRILLQEGFARAMKSFAFSRTEEFTTLERIARAHKVGLWH